MKFARLNSTTNPSVDALSLTAVTEIDSNFDGFIIANDQGISLLMPSISPKPFQVDFNSNQMQYRSLHATYQRELVVRACAIKQLTRPLKILDATAGFGRDSFILAVSGAEVSLVERNPIVALLLEDGLARIEDQNLRERLILIKKDSQEVLQNLQTSEEKPNVIYLDPMFENLERHAKVKKNLQILQALCDATADASQLLSLALKAATHRVVVKRAIHAQPLNGLRPSFCLSGKHSRFDVYVTSEPRA